MDKLIYNIYMAIYIYYAYILNDIYIFYLTTHSTHFIYGYVASDIVDKDHSDSEKGISVAATYAKCYPLTSSVLLYAPSQTG